MQQPLTHSGVNLSELTFLVADPSDLYRDLGRRLLYGFGAGKVLDAADAPAAARLLTGRTVDFLLCAADLPGFGKPGAPNGGIGFVRSIRLNPKHPARSIPIIVTMGTALRMSVGQARDCGANFVLSKPISPSVLYDRIAWIARRPRPFWDSPTYFGPDRRFHDDDYEGAARRRASDGDAVAEKDVA